MYVLMTMNKLNKSSIRLEKLEISDTLSTFWILFLFYDQRVIVIELIAYRAELSSTD